MTRIFVYGTLMSGMTNHHLLDTAKFVRKDRSRCRQYKMLSLGGFPGVVAGNAFVYGEVYDVDDETLASLDRLEGVGRDFYDRDKLITNKRCELVWFYRLVDKRWIKLGDHVLGGDWRKYVEEQRLAACRDAGIDTQ